MTQTTREEPKSIKSKVKIKKKSILDSKNIINNRIISDLKELEQVRKKKAELDKFERERLAPVLVDFKNIPLIYRWFKELVNKSENFKTITILQNRQHFIFIILLLYSPGSILGDKMPNGLRTLLAKVLKLNSEGQISHNRQIVLFLYNNYKDFRFCTDYLYSEILFKIEVNNLK